MGFRSRALLTGVATGFLKGNNDRRDKMAQRMEQLANDSASMERERAKSEYDRNVKSAQEEDNKIESLRALGHIDADNNYTKNYWKDVTYEEWRKNGNGMTQEEFADTYSQGRPVNISKRYKSQQEIFNATSSLYKSIETRQREELGRPVLTGFDRMLGAGIVKGQQAIASNFNEATGAMGVDAKMQPMSMASISDAPQEQTPLASSSAMRDNVTPITLKEDKGIQFKAKAPELAKMQNLIKDSNNQYVGSFVDSSGKVTNVPLGITAPLSEQNKTNRDTESVRLFDRENNMYVEDTTQKDKQTGDILIDGVWVKQTNNIGAMPADVKLEPLIYTDDAGNEMSAQAYITDSAATGAHIVRMPDGLTWAITGKPTFLRGSRDMNKENIPDYVNKESERYAQQRKTANLASIMSKQDFISNPTTWVSSNLSSFTDILGSMAGLTGDNRPADLQAIADYVNKETADDSELREAIGFLDAEAVSSGRREAMEAFLTYSLARSQFGSGKMNVQAIQDAKNIVQPIFRGTERNRASVQTIINNASDEMGRIAGSDISVAMSRGLDSKMWGGYHRVQDEIQRAKNKGMDLRPVPERADAAALVNKVKQMEGAAKDITIRNMKSTFGPNWEETLLKPIRYDLTYDATLIPMYTESKDGSIRIGLFPIK